MRARVVVVSWCVVLVAVACGQGAEEEPGAAGPTASPGQDTAQRAAEQELVVGHAGDPWEDASEEDKKRIPNYPLNADVCETLVVLTTEFEVGEGLASDWELVGDNTFRFTLKEGPTFSDGSPVTAEAVKSSLDYTVEEPQTSGFAFLGPDSTTAVDERTVEVTPTSRNLRLVEQINHPTYSIMAPGSDPLNDVEGMVCTGPFQVSEYVPAERLVVERNENYWGEPAELDKITFRFIPDDTTRTLALQNGEVDLITGVPRGVLSSLEGLAGIRIQVAPVGQVQLAYVARRDVNGNERILADPDLRRAVAHAIDQEAYVEGVLGGNGEVVETVAPPAVLGEHADMVEGIPYDPEAAAELLDEAGWTPGPDGIRVKDGQPLQLDVVFSPGAGGTGIDLTTVEFVQAQLAEVGIRANILQLDPGAYREALDNGTYDLDFSAPNQNDANPAFLLSLRWYSKATGANAQIISPGPDTDFERLIDQTQEATDPEELQRLAAEAMHELVDNEVGVVPMAGVGRIYAMKDTVQGFEPHPSGTNQRWSTVFRTEE
ncbi:MAG TPA: ABC transporter substrate-binding protein [Nitriliruptorales bacterium]|nr:ABC transporter substrate-binding protein [Nitriliruptorales bacterium]